MHTLQLPLSNKILERLSENEIGYFSFTLFKNGKPQVSHCSHPQWLDIYNQYYDEILRHSPICKYLFRSKLRILMWDFLGIDKATKGYINQRNDIVEVSKNITLIYRSQDHLTAMTLGTKHNNAHLINFLNKEEALLVWIEKNLVYNNI